MITPSMTLDTRRDATIWAEQQDLDSAATARLAEWIWRVKPAIGCTYREHPLSSLTEDEFLAVVEG